MIVGKGRRFQLQRLFSAFPGGWPGAGLLLLRAVVSVSLIGEGVASFADRGDLTSLRWIPGLLAVVSGVLLLSGFMTPVVSVFAMLWSLKTWVFLGRGGIADLGGSLLSGVVALALVLLGPGAFSVDCRLFGRRQIVIPQSHDAHQANRGPTS